MNLANTDFSTLLKTQPIDSLKNMCFHVASLYSDTEDTDLFFLSLTLLSNPNPSLFSCNEVKVRNTLYNELVTMGATEEFATNISHSHHTFLHWLFSLLTS